MASSRCPMSLLARSLSWSSRTAWCESTFGTTRAACIDRCGHRREEGGRHGAGLHVCVCVWDLRAHAKQGLEPESSKCEPPRTPQSTHDLTRIQITKQMLKCNALRHGSPPGTDQGIHFSGCSTERLHICKSLPLHGGATRGAHPWCRELPAGDREAHTHSYLAHCREPSHLKATTTWGMGRLHHSIGSTEGPQ